MTPEIAFENGERVLTVEPEVYLKPDADEPTEAGEILLRFAAWLAKAGSVRRVGQQALIVAHLAGQSGCATDAELAKKLKISKSRISQLRADITEANPSLGHCGRRQKLNLKHKCR